MSKILVQFTSQIAFHKNILEVEKLMKRTSKNVKILNYKFSTI